MDVAALPWGTGNTRCLESSRGEAAAHSALEHNDRNLISHIRLQDSSQQWEEVPRSISLLLVGVGGESAGPSLP